MKARSEEEIAKEQEYIEYLQSLDSSTHQLFDAVTGASSQFMSEEVREHYLRRLHLPQDSGKSVVRRWVEVLPVPPILDFLYPDRPTADIDHLKTSIGYRLVNTFILHIKTHEAR